MASESEPASSVMRFVTEAVAVAIIEQLVGKVFEYADMSWWPSTRSGKAEAEKLQLELPQIRMVLTAVQGDTMKKNNPEYYDALMWRFRDAIEEADDVLDEIKYYELEEKVKTRDSKVSGPLSGYKRKLVEFVKNTFVNDGVLNKLREAVKGLEAIASNKELLNKLTKRLNQELVVSNSCESGPYLIDEEVIGREKEKKTIVEWLITQPDGDSQGIVSFFSVYGTGGMGKTTLAQHVCNDQRVIENFDKIVWICVSDNSSTVDAKTIIKKIIQDITRKRYNLDNVSTLQDILKENVTNKKFLLVLDDVWRGEYDALLEWEKMVAPLKFGKKGSKILLTTRMESVAKMVAGVVRGKVENENKYMKLAGLEENDFMALFNRHAFESTKPDKHPHLHEIGNRIAKNLQACPLLAKVIGGVLKNSFNPDFWNNILNEDIINIQASQDYIMDIFKLSYYHLPTHLQVCFRFCSIFPQDYKFTKVELTKMWMGSGLITHEERRPEDVADEYLDQLARKSFFSVEPNENPKGCVYFIHDLLHDLARYVSKRECLRITCDDNVTIPQTIRHLSIKTKNSSVLKEIRKHNKLKSLVISFVDNDLDWGQLNEMLSEVKSLRLLKLSLGEHMIPSWIGDLMHLRYLSIECHMHHTSPKQGFISLKSLCRLYHLQVIRVQTGFGSSWNMQESEMEDMRNLVSLRYLDLPQIVVCNIPWIGKLSSLQELNNFHVKNGSGHKIGELKHLTDLRRLEAYDLKSVSNSDDAMEARMSNKKNMKSLVLDWSDPCKFRGSDENVADKLKPSTNLIELKILNYSGTRSPSWMSDCSCCNLTSVTLARCYKWVNLPPLGHLNSLKYLEIYSMNAVRQVGYSLYGNSNACVFPSLRQLQFSSMPEWEEWIGIDGKLLFPCLDELKICECPKLKRLPAMPCSLRRLSIIGVGLDTLPGLCQVPGDSTIGTSYVALKSSLSYLEVWNCPNILNLVGCELLQEPENFHSLENVQIHKCINLLHMPVEFFAKLPSLTNLSVMDCPKLIFNGIMLPRMLVNLTIGPCCYFENSFVSSLEVLTSLTKLDLDDCKNMQSLPPIEVFSRLTSLCHLVIRRCTDLASLRGIEGITALRTLTIMSCEKLTELSLQQPPLLYQNYREESASRFPELGLTIDRSSLLLLEPLRSLISTKQLEICHDSAMTSLPEQWLLQNRLSFKTLILTGVVSLQSLPANIENLSCLEYLSVHGAKLRSLPNLPPLLKYLRIRECHPELVDLCRKETGLYWSRISCISSFNIWTP